MAHLLWRREAMRLQAASPAAPVVPLRQPCPLPPERQLSPSTLRRLETARRQALVDPPAVPALQSTPPPQAPAIGNPRRRWLREQLVAVLASDTVVCAPNLGATAEELTELFERITGEHFSDTPGVAVTSRVRSLAKVMGNLTRAGVGQPPLQAGKRRDLVTWSRVPCHHADVAAWRRREQLAEGTGNRPKRCRVEMAEADAGLASWVRNHPYITPAAIGGGESGMALLLLWEVDHSCPWPSAAAEDDLSGRLTGFTRRLMRRAAEDAVLSCWLLPQDQQRPLAFGLADTHNFRWPVAIRPPPPYAPQGWWLQFTEAWRAYLATQLHPLRAVPLPTPVETPTSTTAPHSQTSAVRRPRLKASAQASTARRPAHRRPRPSRPVSPSASSTPSAPPATSSIQPLSSTGPPRKRQATLTAWRRSAPDAIADATALVDLEDHPPQPLARHGRATEGPPT